MATGMTLSTAVVSTPLGPLLFEMSDNGVARTSELGLEESLPMRAEYGVGSKSPYLGQARREIQEYFAGRLRAFRTPVDLSSATTPFMEAVWRATMSVPYGELRTYGDIAAAAGRPGAARAAGSALARCPIEIFVPCHRVVRAGPELGSYGRNDHRREFLLRLESSLPLAGRT
jgi:methylated-DNA-[protein]-cysteine S-methyltransferase